MFTIRRANRRGHFNHGWLDTWHTFSFADYYDPEMMGFYSLRVMNEDRVGFGAGFGMHPHRDMEIITYVLEGELQHKDSLGNGAVIHTGELQQMTAGTGVLHSEFNPSPSQEVHLYQIWLHPRQKGLKPSYDQRRFDPKLRVNRWQTVASPDGQENSLTIQQDASLMLANLEAGHQLVYDFAPKHGGWLQILRGGLTSNGEPLHPGDGVAIEDENRLVVEATSDAEVLLFDLK